MIDVLHEEKSQHLSTQLCVNSSLSCTQCVLRWFQYRTQTLKTKTNSIFYLFFSPLKQMNILPSRGTQICTNLWICFNSVYLLIYPFHLFEENRTNGSSKAMSVPEDDSYRHSLYTGSGQLPGFPTQKSLPYLKLTCNASNSRSKCSAQECSTHHVLSEHTKQRSFIWGIGLKERKQVHIFRHPGFCRAQCCSHPAALLRSSPSQGEMRLVSLPCRLSSASLWGSGNRV